MTNEAADDERKKKMTLSLFLIVEIEIFFVIGECRGAPKDACNSAKPATKSRTEQPTFSTGLSDQLNIDQSCV